MKYNSKISLAFNSKHVLGFIGIMVFSMQSLAQNVADSDLSNRAGTNSNWYSQGWVWAIIIALVILLVGAFAIRRRDKDLTRIENEFKRRE